MKDLLLFNETFRRTNELTSRAINLAAGQVAVKNPKDKKEKQYIQFDDNSASWDAALDREVMGTLHWNDNNLNM